MLSSHRARVAAFVTPLLVAAGFPLLSAPAASDLPTVLVSRQLAERGKLHVGDTVTFANDAGGANATRFRVAGIYEPTPDPMRFTAPRIEARMHLPDLIEMTAEPLDPASRESLGGVNVRLADPAEARTFVSELVARAPGTRAQPTILTRDEDPFKVLERFHVA